METTAPATLELIAGASATYSPEDNKIRMTFPGRLDPEIYAVVKAAGFAWAPRQEVFVAPAWSPQREDVALALCGEIDAEESTMAERAAERAERFSGYSASRAKDAQAAGNAAHAVAGRFEFGQPILIGHHSEKRARKDAEKIQNSLEKSAKAWETAAYWKGRAHAATAHADYKADPAVRARRIKGLEADKRKVEKQRDEYAKELAFWSSEGMTHEKGLLHAGNSRCNLRLPRKDGDRPDFDQRPDFYSALSNSYPNLYATRTIEEVVNHAKVGYPRLISGRQRWINHLENRMTYERAMMGESGGLATDQVKPEKGGAVKCLWAPRGGWAYIVKVNKVTVTIKHTWLDGGKAFSKNEPMDKIQGVMTAAQVQAARDAGELVETADKTGFVLTSAPVPAPKVYTPCELETAARMAKDAAKAGVTVAVAHDLFPTPAAIVERMMELADIRPGMTVLEPSAGTGNILRAIPCVRPAGAVAAVEIVPALACAPAIVDHADTVHNGDFLALDSHYFGCLFDRIVMNPPFSGGVDIAHILHAVKFLAPGGRIVALCAGGPRQESALRPLSTEWERLPAGSFKEAGTGVSVVLLTIEL